MSEDSKTMTDEQRQECLTVIGEVVDLAARKSAAGRSSMPITTMDALLLAGLASRGLDEFEITPTQDGPR